MKLQDLKCGFYIIPYYNVSPRMTYSLAKNWVSVLYFTVTFSVSYLSALR